MTNNEMDKEISNILDENLKRWSKAAQHTIPIQEFLKKEFSNEDPWELMKSFFLVMFQMVPVPLEDEEGSWDLGSIMTGLVFEARRFLKAWKKENG